MSRIISLVVLAVLALANGQPLAREGGGLAIARDDCARLVAHDPAGDVAYQPGVDVRGRDVAPAELNESAIELPDLLVIDLTVDLADRLGIPADPDNFQGELDLGTVELRGERAYLNDKPIGDEAQAALAAQCREILGAGE